jgi:hypothetical protein
MLSNEEGIFMKNFKIPLLLLIIVITIAACGGDSQLTSVSDNNSYENGGNGGGGSGYYITIENFGVDPSNLSNDFTFTWKVNYNGIAGYWIEFYINSSNEIPNGVSSIARHFYLNCVGIFCDSPSGTVNCQVNIDPSGNFYTLCQYDSLSPQSHNFSFSGNGYAILKACIYDASLNQICNTKSVQIVAP